VDTLIFNRVISSVAARLPAGSQAKRDLVTTALWHLQDVAYARLREQGFRPSAILDIGAHDGRWALAAREIFDAPILMIEAREEDKQKLLERHIPNSAVAIALLGPEPRDSVPFAVHGSASSLFPERSNARRSTVNLPMRTLDAIAAEHKLNAPLFLTLDVQGGELEILKGATETLARSEVVQLEVALLPYNEGAPTAADAIAFMDQKGFALFDFAGFVRPNNKDLVQIDAIFVRKESALRPKFFTF
jgi:FkbM family methyltransferase